MRPWWVAPAVAALITAGTPPSTAMADELLSSLDSSLASGNTQRLAAIVQDHKDPRERAEIASWLRQKVDSGQAPDKFAQSMIFLSAARKNYDDVLMYLSYYRALLFIDGAQCPDPSSAGSLLEATIFLFSRLTQNSALTQEQKKNAVDRALNLEAATSSVRKRDPSLCEAGLGAYAKDLHVELPKPPQSTDRDTQELARPTIYASDPQWREHRANTRPKLPQLLLTLLGVQTPKGTSTP